MSRKPFNWSLLDRSNLAAMLYQLKDKVVGKRLPVDELQSTLSKHLKKHIPIRVIGARDPIVADNLIYVGGCYYSYYDRSFWTRHIEVSFNYSPNINSIKLTDYRFKRLCQLFADTILHEIIHMRQYRARNFKSIPGYASTAERAKARREQEYYGDTDEMGAFAFNIACEMIDKFGYDPYAVSQYMNDIAAIKRNKRTTFHRYLRAFNWDLDHKIIQRMHRKVLTNLENAYIGKPFKTTNHLTY